MKFGDSVRFTHNMVRHVKWGSRLKIKTWLPVGCHESTGIYLGIRIIMNGDVNEDWVFSPTKHIKVALVCPNSRTNPLYVPLDCIELVEE